MSYDNPWTFFGLPYTELVDNHIGFVYIITNTLTNKRYVGKKNFFFSKTKMVKGKKKKIKVDSDWKEYYSSSEELKSDVEKFGKDNFKREIIKLCHSKGEMSYFEAKIQFEQDVLLYPNLWYNSWISCRVRGSHLKKLVSK